MHIQVNGNVLRQALANKLIILRVELNKLEVVICEFMNEKLKYDRLPLRRKLVTRKPVDPKVYDKNYEIKAEIAKLKKYLELLRKEQTYTITLDEAIYYGLDGYYESGNKI